MKKERMSQKTKRASRGHSRATSRHVNPLTILNSCEQLIKTPYNPHHFAYSFLEAYHIPQTTIARLQEQEGTYNKTDLPPDVISGGVALCVPSSIHLCALPFDAHHDQLERVFYTLKNSPATKREKVRFLLATNGVDIWARYCLTEEECLFSFHELPLNKFGFFFPLAGICVPSGRRGNIAVDIKATDKLNKLYTLLLEKNAAWSQNRPAMNHFMTRLIFCFFAENTQIFPEKLFTETLRTITHADGSTVQEVISACFRAMDTPYESRATANLPAYVQQFPYVNGRLFAPYDESDTPETPAPNISDTDTPGTDIHVPDFYAPIFDKTTRAHLLTIGELNWSEIEPDIFGSMIQAIAEEEERAALGMHYTSVDNILNVLNPLLLNPLRQAFQDAGEDSAKLQPLRTRLSHIRVFDPACGAGNFLVIAYQQLRALEYEINQKLHQETAPSQIPLDNFRGIELRDFPARVARIALVIAKFQCDTRYVGKERAIADILPLSKKNWITCGNALLLEWRNLCPPSGTESLATNTTLLSGTPQNHENIAFANTGGETYLCGNPPYKGTRDQTAEQKSDMHKVFDGVTPRWKSFDYVCGFFYKAAEYCANTPQSRAALVSSNSLCQGQSVPYFFPLILGRTPPSRREAQTPIQQTTAQRKQAA